MANVIKIYESRFQSKWRGFCEYELKIQTL